MGKTITNVYGVFSATFTRTTHMVQLSLYLYLSFLLEASLSFQFNISVFEGHSLYLCLHKTSIVLVHVQNRPDRYVFSTRISINVRYDSHDLPGGMERIPRQLLSGLSATETPCIKHLSQLRTRFHADPPTHPPPHLSLLYPPSL